LIQSRATRQFWRLLSRLPAEIQQEAKRVYRLFRANPAHPGLHFKKLEGHDSIYSARISLGYRALAVRKGERVVWYWIGSHAEYDRLV
jgi:hypothetical protein